MVNKEYHGIFWKKPIGLDSTTVNVSPCLQILFYMNEEKSLLIMSWLLLGYSREGSIISIGLSMTRPEVRASETSKG